MLQQSTERGLVSRSVCQEGERLATLAPMSPSFVFPALSLTPDRQYQLSRFAYSRQDGGEMLLESPLAHARVVLHDGRAAALVHALAQPQRPAEARTRVAGLSAEATGELMTLLLNAQMLGEAREQGVTCDDGTLALRSWEFHDLLFHARSRAGRHNYPKGGTYRFLGQIDPPPPLKPARLGESIPLYRPDLDRLERDDPPFAWVQEARHSIREYGDPPISAAQLGEFLYRVGRVADYWTTDTATPHGPFTMDFAPRPYPAGGALYELELYTAITNCANIASGLYYYDPQHHRLDRVCGRTADVEQLLTDANWGTGIPAENVQVLIIIASRFQRIAWKYASLAYALTLKHVGVLYQTMYLVATAMRLAPCAIGCGDADRFARAAGTDYYAESSVGEFLLGKQEVIADRPEIELLLRCARRRIDAPQAERIRDLVRRGIDWKFLRQTADAHGLTPLLYAGLNTVCPKEVPGAVLEGLRDQYLVNGAHNLFLTDELLKLLGLFQSRGISAVPFKGPVLAAAAYGDLFLRGSVDLDILVHERDVQKAKDLLVSHGFALLLDHYETEAQERHFLHHCALHRRGLLVEIHWSFAEPYFSVPLDRGLWDRLQTVSLAGTEVPHLAAEDLLLVLCVHATRHGWARLLWHTDVAEVVRASPHLNWEQVLKRARKMGTLRILFLGLLLSSDALGLALPESIRRRMEADPVAMCLAKEVQTNLFRRLDEATREATKYLFDVRVRERLRDRVRYCRRLGIIPEGADRAALPPLARCYLHFAAPFTVNERDWHYVRLPAALSFLYYLVRPIRLMAKFGLGLLSSRRSAAP